MGFKAPRVFFDKGKEKVKSFEKESEILEPRRTDKECEDPEGCMVWWEAGSWVVGGGHEAGRRVL